MGYTYNITFIVSPEDESRLIDYLRKRLIPALFTLSSLASEPQLRKVVETGGEKLTPEHGLSLALSVQFLTEDEAHQWYTDTFAVGVESFHQEFGHEALYFPTLLENIEI